MGRRRKGNPNFHLGVDSLGRRSWRRRRDVNAVGLRGALCQQVDDGPPISQLPPQVDRDKVQLVDGATRRLAERFVDERSKGSLPLFTVPASVAGVSFALFGLPVVSLPLLVFALGNLFVVPQVRKWRARRDAKRQVLGNYTEVVDASLYRQEADVFADGHPRWDGGCEAYRGETGRIQGFEVECVVDGRGVGEVSWKEMGSRGDDVSSGRVLAYPGANWAHHGFDFPVDLPNVNLQHANLRGVVLLAESTLDGADLRGVNAADSQVRASLVGANLAGANLRGAQWQGCVLDDANLAGADLTDSVLPIDLTGVELTREQFDSLRSPHPFFHGHGNTTYRVKELPVEDVLAAFGGDREAAAMALWSGDVDVRNRSDNTVAVGKFDPEKQYVPAWAADDFQQVAQHWRSSEYT